MTSRAYIDAYRQNSVQSASPLQLVIMLYDGCLRFLEQAKDAMGRQDLYTQNQSIQKAQRILTELTSCLDMKQGGEVAENLFALYTYCYNELVEANMLDSTQNIDQAMAVLASLRDSWGQLELQQKGIPVQEERLAS